MTNTIDIYDKGQVDTKLGAKANASDVYTKSEANDLLSAKANASDVYTKSEANDLLSAKADASNVYTKTEMNTALAGKQDSLPSMTDNAGKVLTVNAGEDGTKWSSVLPSIGSGDAGKVLAVNSGETGTEWVNNVVRTTGDQTIIGTKSFQNVITKFNPTVDYFDNNTVEDWTLAYKDKNGHELAVFVFYKNADKTTTVRLFVRNSNDTWKDVVLLSGDII